MRWTRVIVYAALIILALLFLVPLGVVVVNSLRSSREIAATSLIGWPSHLIFTNYGQAWNRFCMAEHCWRSEEHTSELQSQFHLVCRLLLEKKKKTHQNYNCFKQKNKENQSTRTSIVT